MAAYRTRSLPSDRRLRVTPWLYAVVLLCGFPWLAHAQSVDPWLQTEQAVARDKLVTNILNNGAVIASPSRDDPNYYFHWVRDGALTMDTVVTLYMQSQTPVERSRYFSRLQTHLDFCLRIQTISNPSSALGRGLGEPKFNTDGTAFEGSWGRPQDDGPALRALTFTHLANYLLDQGGADQAQLVKTKLYDGSVPTNSVIKRDLEYVSHHWQETCFDLWEEVRGHHFYTRMVQRRGLVEGAKLAKRLKDPGAADWYNQQAAALEKEIRNHWDQGKGYLVATLDRDGGLNSKTSGLDTAVILAVLHADASDDSFFAPTDDQVLATAAKLTTTFQGLYSINKVQEDGTGGRLGTALGRYPEDVYTGHPGGFEGNPWVLCTLALAELSYRAAHRWEKKGQVNISELNKPFFVLLAPDKFGKFQPGQSIKKGDDTFQAVLSALRDTGDRQLRRVKYHAFPDGSLSEQINRYTGFMQSARDLTWNYASVLTTLFQRGGPQQNTKDLRLAMPASGRSLNRGGIPIADVSRDPNLPSARTGRFPRGVPGSTGDLRLRVAELEATVEKLSREVRELRKVSGASK